MMESCPRFYASPYSSPTPIPFERKPTHDHTEIPQFEVFSGSHSSALRESANFLWWTSSSSSVSIFNVKNFAMIAIKGLARKLLRHFHSFVNLSPSDGGIQTLVFQSKARRFLWWQCDRGQSSFVSLGCFHLVLLSSLRFRTWPFKSALKFGSSSERAFI